MWNWNVFMFYMLKLKDFYISLKLYYHYFWDIIRIYMHVKYCTKSNIFLLILLIVNSFIDL